MSRSPQRCKHMAHQALCFLARKSQSSLLCSSYHAGMLCKVAAGVQAVAIPGNYVFDTVTIVSSILTSTLPLTLLL